MIGRPGCGVLQMNGQPTAQNTRECGGDGELPVFRNWENPDHVAELAELWNVDPLTHPALGTSDARDGDLPPRRAGIDPVPVGHRHQPGRLAARAGAHPQGARQARAVPGRAGRLPHRDGRACRRRAAGRGLGREDRHLHERRPHRPPVRTRRSTRPARRGPTSTSSSTSPGGWTSADDGRPLHRMARPEDAFAAWQECSRGRLCDYTGLTYDNLRREAASTGRAASEPDGTQRLYTDADFRTDAD